MDANGVAHLPRLQPALEADIPLAWQEDWRIIKSLAGRLAHAPSANEQS
jgi:hypothetical protein